MQKAATPQKKPLKSPTKTKQQPKHLSAASTHPDPRSLDWDKLTPITKETLEQHCTAGDAWLLIEGVIYDVSNFHDDHPGGSLLMLNAAGKDCTREFYMRHNLKHLAQEKFQALVIGKLVGEEEQEMRAKDTSAEVLKNMILDYSQFVSGKKGLVDLRQDRIELISRFLQNEMVSESELAQRVQFLEMNGYQRAEIEDAFEKVSLKDYVVLLESKSTQIVATPTINLCTPRENSISVGILKSPHSSTTPKGGNRKVSLPSMTTLDVERRLSTTSSIPQQHRGSLQGGPLPPRRQSNRNPSLGYEPADFFVLGGGSSSDRSDDRQSTTGSSSVLRGTGPYAMWRIGVPVYAFCGNHSYEAVPLLEIDATRMEENDVMVVRLHTADGVSGYTEKLHMPVGFKGVIADEYPSYHLVNKGDTVIAEWPNSTAGHYREAVVLEKSELQDGTQYGVTLEWVHNTEVLKDVDYRSIRTVIHPEILQSQYDDAKAKNTTEKHGVQTSSSSFPIFGTEEDVEIVKRKYMNSSPEDIQRKIQKTYLRGYQHYPELDIQAEGSQPEGVRTAEEFISIYGETLAEARGEEPQDLETSNIQQQGTFAVNLQEERQNKKYLPLAPHCQRIRSSRGFGFNLQMFARHSCSHHHYRFNPILEVAQQCKQQDTMFIDPDFPPSYRSLWGHAASVDMYDPAVRQAQRKIVGGDEEEQISVTWKRASEMIFRPRVSCMGSQPLEIKPGYFTPVWLVPALIALNDATEFEENISPMEDGWVYGAYTVKFFLNSTWTYVVVDDFLPCNEETGEPISMLSGHPNEIYPCLIEKALAKIEGSYAQLKFARPQFNLGRVWSDISTNVVESFQHDCIGKKESICANLQDFVMVENKTCKVFAHCDTDKKEFGFQREVLWLTSKVVKYVTVHDPRAEPQYFFKVVRPTQQGLPVPNIVDCRNHFFAKMNSEAVDTFPETKTEPVSYWLSAADYFEIFNKSVIFHISNDCQRICLAGSWHHCCNSVSQIGWKTEGLVKWLNNPQYLIAFVQPTDVIIELTMLDGRFSPEVLSDPAAHVLQLHLLHGPMLGDRLTSDDGIIASSLLGNLVDDVEFRNHPSVSIKQSLKGGSYVLIPSIGGPACGEKFLIKVFSVAAFYMRILE